MPGRGMGERLAVDPKLSSTLYFGARSGHGLWKSTDSGATWSNVTNFPNVGEYLIPNFVAAEAKSYEATLLQMHPIQVDTKAIIKGLHG